MSSTTRPRRALAAALLAALLLSGCEANAKPRQTVVYVGPAGEVQTMSSPGVPNFDTEAAPTRSAPAAEGETYILNAGSVKFHRPSCAWADRIKEENRIEWTGDRETLLQVGYKPCSICKP